MRACALLLLAFGVARAQLPQGLIADLQNEKPFIREEAVLRLGQLAPSDVVPAETLAKLLVKALEDPDAGVRQNAAQFLGKDRPSDIAVPALVGELSRLWFDTLSSRDPSRDKRWSLDLGDRLCLYVYAVTLMGSLEQHRDERAVQGLADAARGWRLDRVPGAAVEMACGILCRWETQEAFDAVVDTLARGSLLPVKSRTVTVEPSTLPRGTMVTQRRRQGSDRHAPGPCAG